MAAPVEGHGGIGISFDEGDAGKCVILPDFNIRVIVIVVIGVIIVRYAGSDGGIADHDQPFFAVCTPLLRSLPHFAACSVLMVR